MDKEKSAEQLADEIEGLRDYLVLAAELDLSSAEIRRARARIDAAARRLCEQARPFFIQAVHMQGFGSGTWAWPNEETRAGVERGLLADAVLSWRQRVGEESSKRTDALSTHVHYFVKRHYGERRDAERNRLGLVGAPENISRFGGEASGLPPPQQPPRPDEFALSEDVQRLLSKLPDRPHPYRSLTMFLFQRGYDFDTPRKTPGLLAEFADLQTTKPAERTVRLWLNAALQLLPAEKVRASLGLAPNESWRDNEPSRNATARARTEEERTGSESGKRSAVNLKPDEAPLRAPKVRGFNRSWEWKPERYAVDPGHVATAEQRRAYEEFNQAHPGETAPAIIPWTISP